MPLIHAPLLLLWLRDVGLIYCLLRVPLRNAAAEHLEHFTAGLKRPPLRLGASFTFRKAAEVRRTGSQLRRGIGVAGACLHGRWQHCMYHACVQEAKNGKHPRIKVVGMRFHTDARWVTCMCHSCIAA